MNKIPFLFALILPVILMAQSLDVTDRSQNDALADPAASVCIEVEQLANYPYISDSYEIPSFNLYQKYWDTANLRSSILEIPFSNDRLMLMLVQDANNPFVMPCRYEKIKTFYGLAKSGDFHPGVDIVTDPQTLVKSCFDGVVRMARSYGDYGLLVVVRHYNGLETVYSKLGKICVRPGQIIKAGQVLGQTCNSSNSRDCLIHFEVRFMNEHIDPELIIDFEEEELLQNNIALMSRDFNIIPLDSYRRKVKSQPMAETVAQPQKQEVKEEKVEAKKEVVPVEQPQPSAKEYNNQQEATYHTVKTGENLYRISLKYNTTVDAILKLNNLKNADKIVEGQKLRVR